MRSQLEALIQKWNQEARLLESVIAKTDTEEHKVPVLSARYTALCECADELEALRSAPLPLELEPCGQCGAMAESGAGEAGAVRDSIRSEHLNRGHTITSSEQYDTCSCGATYWRGGE